MRLLDHIREILDFQWSDGESESVNMMDEGT